MIDSGAFSAHNLGKSVDLAAYCRWLHENGSWIDTYINLDKLDLHNLEAGAAEGWANYQFMRKQGLRPIPVLHAGEDISWLHRYLDDGADYVALAAVAFIPKRHTDAWYAAVWDHLVTPDGRPVIKVHALGEGREASMKLFPWKSVDTASWFYESMVSGTFYTEGGRRLNMRADGASTATTTHVKSLDPESRELFEACMADAGVNVAVFDAWLPRDAYVVRSYLMALYYKKMEARVNAQRRTTHAQSGLLHTAYQTQPGVDIGLFNLCLVWSDNPAALPALGAAQVKCTLMSYFYILNPKHDGVSRWVDDPIGWCKSNPKLSPYYNALKEHVREIG